jgi:hypothetical protein
MVGAMISVLCESLGWKLVVQGNEIVKNQKVASRK